MARKTTTKTVRIRPNVNKNTFKGTAVAFKEEDPAVELKEAVEAREQEIKEEKLLEYELEKPLAQRNKALMKKYGYSEHGTNIDNYPNIDGTNKYNIKMYAPEEDSIPLELRPKPWYVGTEIDHNGNKFTYRFPVSRSTYYEGDNVYKLDGFDVFLDSSYDVIEGISTYDLYTALLDYKSGNKAMEPYITKVFKDYGIIGNGNPFKDSTKKDFRVVNRGFTVAYSISSKGADNKPKVTPVDDGPNNFVGYITADVVTIIDGTDKTTDDVKKIFDKTKAYKFDGLKSTDKISKHDLVLEGIMTNKAITALTFCVLSSYDGDNHKLGFTIVNGIKPIVPYLNGAKATRDGVKSAVIRINREMYELYKKRGEDSVPDIFGE